MAGEFGEPIKIVDYPISDSYGLLDCEAREIAVGQDPEDPHGLLRQLGRIEDCFNAFDGIADPAAVMQAAKDYCEASKDLKRSWANWPRTAHGLLGEARRREAAALSRLRAEMGGD